MGPRARARGNLNAYCNPREFQERFNGATSARSWKYGPLRRLRHSPLRFNGATSARSWKSKTGFGLHVTVLCFNGATSARSWKYHEDAAEAREWLASMGPRARARGNMTGYQQVVAAVRLQWGHERALVEITRASSHSPAISWLQWGHERALVEIRTRRETPTTLGRLQWGHERALVEIREARGARE